MAAAIVDSKLKVSLLSFRHVSNCFSRSFSLCVRRPVRLRIIFPTRSFVDHVVITSCVFVLIVFVAPPIGVNRHRTDGARLLAAASSANLSYFVIVRCRQLSI
jgi:hypothetical protein